MNYLKIKKRDNRLYLKILELDSESFELDLDGERIEHGGVSPVLDDMTLKYNGVTST